MANAAWEIAVTAMFPIFVLTGSFLCSGLSRLELCPSIRIVVGSIVEVVIQAVSDIPQCCRMFVGDKSVVVIYMFTAPA